MTQKIYRKLSMLVQMGKTKFAIYPCGKRGKQLGKFLDVNFKMADYIFVDNKVFDNDRIISCSDIPIKLDDKYTFLVCSEERSIYHQLREELSKYVSGSHIVDILLDTSWNKEAFYKVKDGGAKTRVIFNPVFKYSSLSDPMMQVGCNTGNLVFSEGLKKNVKHDLETFLSVEWTRDYLGRQNVKSIMPAANFLSKEAIWLERYVPILENTDMSFTLAGLGAQAKLDETPNDVVNELSEGQKRFFALVSERAISIGVRGEFTAECLNKMGIKNVDIIGCPSFYKYADSYKILKQSSMDRVACTLSKSDFKVYDFACQVNAKIVSQVYNDIGEPTKNIFFDYNDWCDFMVENDFTFAFGTRFHGNMMALNHGVPTLWLVHDWRTRELVEYLKLPHLELFGQFQKVKYPEELMEYYDYTEVYKNYSKLYRIYCEFIDKNLS